ncbi:Bacterioferritin [Acetobacter malorum]|uniref:Bacterioferritin n=1 Tax=Acetobacter malorum TaxID=178901 RepID=A0A177G3W2_9PROT|nr:Bacterioferritin [Acetobacter malorum]
MLALSSQPEQKVRIMVKDAKVIEHLNTQLTNELTAINQYFPACPAPCATGA